MQHPTRGTVYKSSAAVQANDRRQTVRLVSGIGTAVLTVAGVALIASLAHPPLLNWLWS